jgi:uncharacterized protein YifN (PemK superfamily)
MITGFKAGNVFLLDFDQFNPESYEMTKERLVVVVSPLGLKRDRRLATIVPLSTSAPYDRDAKHSIPLSEPYYWGPRGGAALWAKCDMIRTVSIERLDHIRAYAKQGKNRIPVPELRKDDLKRIRLGVAYAVGLDAVIVPDAKAELGTFLKRFRNRLMRSRRDRDGAHEQAST